MITALALATTLSYLVSSPDGSLTASVQRNDQQQFCLTIIDQGDTLLAPSPIGLEVAGRDVVAGATDRVTNQRKRLVNQSIQAPFYRQQSIIYQANQLQLKFRSGFSFILQVSDQGVAYRFCDERATSSIINNEIADYRFPGDPTAWLAYSTNAKEPFAMAFQNTYHQTPLSQAQSTPLFLPATIDCGKAKLTLLESDLEHYPGMFLQAQSGHLQAVFAPYPAQTGYYPWRHMTHVTQTTDHIAEQFTQTPWRIFAVTHDDCKMPVNDLVYALASPSRIDDVSWIRPGKVAWDWWNDWNLTGVDFPTGINMPTYRYYIDFAAAQGLEYVVLDEGWYDPARGDMLTVTPDLNLEELIAYGKSRGVDLILWCVFNVLDEQLEAACSHYSQLGIKGFKVDFLDRDDQTAVEMAYRLADCCARHRLMLDYHGFYKPSGLNRTYPNIVNFEAVFGMEEMKWSPKEVDMPTYNVTFPYIRMMSGPVDFTPGAMRNATKADWNASYSTPISQGTRCHQLATYVVYDSPLTMLCDAPTMYEREPEYTQFLASIPTTFDQTKILCGELGQYIVTARRTGNDWYIAGMTSWEARDLQLPLDFLPSDNSSFQATLYADGINAHRQAQDYQVLHPSISAQAPLSIHLAPGGGFLLKLKANTK